jgi:hypothetical protein
MCLYIGGCRFACDIDDGHCITSQKKVGEFKKRGWLACRIAHGPLQAALGKMSRQKRMAGLRRPGTTLTESVISGKRVDNGRSRRASGTKDIFSGLEKPPVAGTIKALGLGDGHIGVTANLEIHN